MSHVNITQIKQFISNQNTDVASADDAVDEFLKNYSEWKGIVGYIYGAEDGDHLYGAALCTFSGNLYYASVISADKVRLLHNEIKEYETCVKYNYGYKNLLYSNLVACLHKLSLASTDELKDLLKKSIYYSIAGSNHDSFQLDCYAYRPISNYLLQSFRDEQLSMSSPISFNDPFDCPILELLDLYGDNISKLIKEAYQDCLKITCFVSNVKVKPVRREDGSIQRVYKHENDPEEYLSELMWAHYAKNHTGVCVKYHFKNSFTKFADEGKGQIAYFRDIRYTSDIYGYGEKDSINLSDAFFVKSKAWEYENELRLLSFDPLGFGKYASIDAKNCIAAIYFGLKCPKEEREEIIDILKDRTWVNEKSVMDKDTYKLVKINKEFPIDFYQMEIDKKHFGKLKAVKLM